MVTERLAPIPPTHNLVDPKTGQVNRAWHRWLEKAARQIDIRISIIAGPENNVPVIGNSGELVDSGIDIDEVALLPGRAGGQALKGGVAASESLTIESTAHATKGDVICKDRFLLDTNGRAWVDVNLGAMALGSGASAPGVVVLSGGIYAVGFDGVSTMEQLFGCIEIPHEWAEGTDIYPHVHWLPATSAAGNVKWQLEYTWVNRNAVEPASATISVVQATPGAIQNSKAEFPAIAGAGKLVNSQIAFRLFRDPTDAADTYGADALVKTFGFHVQVNTHGSRTQGAK